MEQFHIVHLVAFAVFKETAYYLGKTKTKLATSWRTYCSVKCQIFPSGVCGATELKEN